MDLSIYNNNFVSKVYDKRRDFSFKVRNLTHFDSNLAMSSKVGLFIGQLNRFLVINSDYEFFLSECRSIKEKLSYLQYPVDIIAKGIKGFLNRYGNAVKIKFWKELKMGDMMCI